MMFNSLKITDTIILPLSKSYQSTVRLFHQNLKGLVQVLVAELIHSIPQHDRVRSRSVQFLILWPSLGVDNEVWTKIVLSEVAATGSCGRKYFFLAQMEPQSQQLPEESATQNLSFIGTESQRKVGLTNPGARKTFNYISLTRISDNLNKRNGREIHSNAVVLNIAAQNRHVATTCTLLLNSFD